MYQNVNTNTRAERLFLLIKLIVLWRSRCRCRPRWRIRKIFRKEAVEKAVENVLKTFDGVDKLSKEQVSEGNCTLYSGNNVLAILPTGFGKSLLFQLIPGMCVALNRMAYPVYPKSPSLLSFFR